MRGKLFCQREHDAQNTPPQARQWCLRVNVENSSRHPKQTCASRSRHHRTAILADTVLPWASLSSVRAAAEAPAASAGEEGDDDEEETPEEEEENEDVFIRRLSPLMSRLTRTPAPRVDILLPCRLKSARSREARVSSLALEVIFSTKCNHRKLSTFLKMGLVKLPRNKVTKSYES